MKMSRSSQNQKTKITNSKWLAFGLIVGCIVIGNILWKESPRSVNLDILLIAGLIMLIGAIAFAGNDGLSMRDVVKGIPLSVLAGLVVGIILCFAVGAYLLGGIE